MSATPPVPTPGDEPACWVSLTYDGLLHSHVEVAVPELKSRSLPATFFGAPEDLVERATAWRAVADEGINLGCHPLFKSTDPFGNLPNWTLDMVEYELRSCRKLFTELIYRQSDFPFAYPGPERGCLKAPHDHGATSYEPIVRRLFGVARGAIEGINDRSRPDLGMLFRYETHSHTAEEIIRAVQEAERTQGWIVLVFGGIGEGDFGIDATAHSKFLDWLSQRTADVRVGSLVGLASRVRGWAEAQGAASQGDAE